MWNLTDVVLWFVCVQFEVRPSVLAACWRESAPAIEEAIWWSGLVLTLALVMGMAYCCQGCLAKEEEEEPPPRLVRRHSQ